MSRERFKIEYCSEILYSAYDYSGHLEYEFNATKGTDYNFTLLLSQRTLDNENYDQDEPHGDIFLVYVDGEFVDSIRQNGFISPWFGYYSINLYLNDLSYNEQTEIVDYRHKSCEQIIGTFEDDFGYISIENGNEYLSFYNVDSTTEYVGDSFYAKDYLNKEYPKVIYDTPYYGDDAKGIIKGEVNGVIVYDTLNIMPISDISIKVDILPEKIEPGDTANITLQQRNEDGTLEAFPGDQIFNVNLGEGNEDYGVLLSPNGIDTSDSFTDIQQGFKFIANKTLNLDSVEVLIKVSTVIGNEEESATEQASVENNNQSLGKKITNEDNNSGNKKERIITPIDPGGGGPQEIFGTGRVIVKNNTIEILLGETKYFALKKKKTQNKYKIIEIPTTYGNEPKWTNVTLGNDWEWVKNANVWGTGPIEVESGTNYGKKQGVYWEKKYPVYSGNKFQKMKDLDAGLIRIIGRYWYKDSTYVVKLKATDGNNKTTIKLKVVKPKKIGVKKDKLIDVKGNEYNLDDLIIKYAGLNGVSPQIIKGIIEKESSFSNGMRWEPFFEIEPNRSLIHVKDKNGNYKHPTMSKGRYRIKSSTDLGYPGIPTDHKPEFINNGGNNYPNEYWGYQGSVWDLFYQNCKQVNPNAEHDLYPDKGPSKWPRKFRNGWSTIYNKEKNKYISGKILKNEIDSLEIIVPYSSEHLYGISKANEWAKNTYRGGVMSEIAQTRIATSYGLMQVLYTSATAYLHYPEEYNTDPTPQIPSYLPEYLNEKDISLKYGSEGIAFYVDKEIEYKNDRNNYNWTAGFERTFAIGLFGYNHGFHEAKNDRYTHKNYGYDVLKRAKKYLPSN